MDECSHWGSNSSINLQWKKFKSNGTTSRHYVSAPSNENIGLLKKTLLLMIPVYSAIIFSPIDAYFFYIDLPFEIFIMLTSFFAVFIVITAVYNSFFSKITNEKLDSKKEFKLFLIYFVLNIILIVAPIAIFAYYIRKLDYIRYLTG